MIPIVLAGRLDPCVLLAYDAPAEQVRPLVPAPLRPVERDGRAFWGVVVCKVDKMRPAGLPRFFGMSYIHVAYRIYVTVRAASGDTIGGLYFVRSDGDRALVAVPGNWTSDFKFHRSLIDLKWNETSLSASVKTGGPFDAALEVEATENDGPAPDALLKYSPLGLGCAPGGRTVRLAEVIRDERAWSEVPARAPRADFQFFKTLKQDVRFLQATRVAAIDYRWRLGRELRVTM